MNPPVLIVWIVLGYFALGVLVALPFVLVGVRRVDPVAAGASLFVRLLFVPGAAALWPVMLSKWMRAAPDGRASSEKANANEDPHDGA